MDRLKIGKAKMTVICEHSAKEYVPGRDNESCKNGQKCSLYSLSNSLDIYERNHEFTFLPPAREERINNTRGIRRNLKNVIKR